MKTKPLIAFHGDPTIKEKYLARIRAHAEADELVKGQYWQNGKGCAIGCILEEDFLKLGHKGFEVLFEIPEPLAHLLDFLFEGLPNDLAMTWPERAWSAIPVGADLSKVNSQFLVWLLVDPQDGVVKFARPEDKAVIQRVADLHKRVVLGDEPTSEEWAASAASAASAAAWAASAADRAADRAAESADRAAESAAWAAASATWAATWAAARSPAWASWAAACDAADADWAARAADSAVGAAWAARAAASAISDAAWASTMEAARKAYATAIVKQSEKLLELLKK